MNVVFIVLDTVRRDRLSPYNSSIEFTPNIEELADECMVYTQAVAQAPWTLPSHGSMFTGSYPWEHGATQKKLYLDTDQELLAERFREEGYRTACYSANPWISNYTGLSDGFDDVRNYMVLSNNPFIEKIGRKLQKLGIGRHPVLSKIFDLGKKLGWRNTSNDPESATDQIIEDSQDFIQDAKDSDDDFFLFINLMDAPGIDPDDVCRDPKKYETGEAEPDFEALSKLYNAEIDYLDDRVGDLVTTLRDQELLDDTVIVVASDHGENLGEEGRFGHQFSVSEALVHVPLLVRHPDREASRIDDQVELRQLYNLIPAHAGIDDMDNPETEYALGGYAYPEFDLQKLPERVHERLGKELRFVRTRDRKLVRSRNGEKDYTMHDLVNETTIKPEDDFIDRVESMGKAESGRKLEDRDEKVKKRLRDLGYM
ncbi:MAG: sulfatase [Candidatus Nanohaloarchaea archaeon]|nr:sulfatase [Candidatus Nanohaloarchaea archaeon]